MARVRQELVLREAQQRRAIPFGLAAHIEVFLGNNGTAVAVLPPLAAQKRPFMHHALDIEGAAVRRQMTAFLDQGDIESAEGQSIGASGTTRAGADHDGIVCFGTHGLVLPGS